MMMIVKMTCTSTISIKINGVFFRIKVIFLYQDQEPKEFTMITNCISLVVIKRKVAIFIKIYSITIWSNRSGLM